jgi:hypothetical protein
MNILRVAALSAAIASACLTSSAEAACDVAAARRTASAVTGDFSTLVGFTKAVCTASRDGNFCAIICISDLNIIGDNRNLVLTVIAASSATRMRAAGLSNFSRVAFADRDLLTARRALFISAATASDLQRTLGSRSVSPLVTATRVAAAYSVMDIPKSK